MKKNGYFQRRIHLMYPLDTCLKMNYTLKACVYVQWLQQGKGVHFLWLQWGWAAGMLRAVYRCHLCGCSRNREMSKEFLFLSSAQWPVKRYRTSFMLIRDVFLCKRRRRPWCYVENGAHPWHAPAQVPGKCKNWLCPTPGNVAVVFGFPPVHVS